MSVTHPLHRRTLFAASFISLALVGAYASRAAHADGVGEGRKTAPVPVGPNVTQVAPPDSPGFVYEKARIKRTVSLNVADPLTGKWDPLYSVQDTTGGNAAGVRSAYLDWDDNYVYVAVECPAPEQVRIDMDLADDGWLRGADNLSLLLTPPAPDAGADAQPKLTAQRFDMAQNRDQPVWAASPIPPEQIRVRGGQTPRGTYVVLLAIPGTEAMGLKREAGQSFGLRIDAATPMLPSAAGEANLIPIRPMMRLGLAEEIPATDGGLAVNVSIDGPHDITPGGEVRGTIEVANNTKATVRLSRVILTGSLGDADFLDEQKFAGTDIEPGKSYKKSIRSSVAPAAPFGALVLRGEADEDGGAPLAALASFRKVEPYLLALNVDSKPVPAGGENGTDARRNATIILGSRVNARVTAKVKLILPDGWKLENGVPDRELALKVDGEQQAVRYRFIVPVTASLGPHTIEAVAEVGGRTYHATGTITLIP